MKLFSYHPNPSAEQKKHHAILENAFNAAADAIFEHVADEHYRAMALEELEKSGAIAVKGVYKNSDGSFQT